MKTQITLRKALTAALVVMTMAACQKEVAQKADAFTAIPVTAVPVKVTGLQLTDNKVVLLQGNANNKALGLTWNANTTQNVTYTIEAALDGAGFEDAVELGTTNGLNMQLGVQDLNKKLCQLILPGNTATIAVRVRANQNGNAVFTEPMAAQVTTYIDYVDYPNYMRVAGNFQNWIVATAPKLVATKADGMYEGYVNFNLAYPQFLFVKGDAWGPANTFTNIGNGKIGFGGDIAAVKDGAGTYLVRVNTNTNQWNCTKIRTWGIHGTAVGNTADADPVMYYDAEKGLYTIALTLQKGTFRFRANDNDAVTLGATTVNGYKVPDAAGADFVVDKAGTYQLMLDLKIPGNYACNMARNPLAVAVNTRP